MKYNKMNKINIGIAGLNFGKTIVSELISHKDKSDYFNVSAVCDLDIKKASALAGEIGAKAYGSLDDILKDDEIRAVGLFTGPVKRAELIGKIIESKKDVMTTKPFELDAPAAKAVLDAAVKSGRVVHLNSPAPSFSEDMELIFEWREKYNLGRPVACRCDVWTTYKETADGTWYDDPNLCPAPPIYRLGVYVINDLVQLFGEPDSFTVMQSGIFTKRPTADNAQMGILFKNKVIANIFSSFCINDGQRYRNSLVINYENGTIYRNIGPLKADEPGQIKVIAHDGAVYDSRECGETSGGYRWKDFYDAVNGKKVNTENYNNSIVSGVKIMSAMKEAQFSGGVVKL
jgi:predicted dehydrogenase